MATGLIDIMKRAAMDANEASNPSDLRYGTVTKETPLEVAITTTFVLPEEMLIVPESLTDHEVEVSSAPDYIPYYLFVHAGLRVGDRVALIREKGGRKYFVLDRF